MGLALFGLALLTALVALCWKNFGAVFVAVLAVMLGMTIANSNGFMADPSQSFTDGTRDFINGVANKLFAGSR
jgi:p-aminobenzoyl-glutamate transporter AbgT